MHHSERKASILLEPAGEPRRAGQTGATGAGRDGAGRDGAGICPLPGQGGERAGQTGAGVGMGLRCLAKDAQNRNLE